MQDILAIVLAGGEGARLQPLTAERCKPAMPFHGRHYLVDFVLSNLVNSGIGRIYLMIQYRPQALIEHVARSWSMASGAGGRFITVVPPQMHGDATRFHGTADALFQNIRLIETLRPRLVAVFAADHVYRMDVRQMVNFHRASGADATVATVPVPVQSCHQFGIVQSDPQGRVLAFSEKPCRAAPARGSDTHADASMGNYIFDTEVLLDQLRRMHAAGGTDFGRHILPGMVGSHRLRAYDFSANRVPGRQPGEEPAYWRDVGTLDAYFEAQLDAVGARPKFSMTNLEWPIHAGANPVGSAEVESGVIRRCVLGAGCMVEGGTLERTILRPGVQVEAGVELEECIVMDGVRIGSGARVRRAIIDQDNCVPVGECIGLDPARDRARFQVTPAGVVVVPAGYFPPAGRLPSAPTKVDDAAVATPVLVSVA